MIVIFGHPSYLKILTETCGEVMGRFFPFRKAGTHEAEIENLKNQKVLFLVNAAQCSRAEFAWWYIKSKENNCIMNFAFVGTL